MTCGALLIWGNVQLLYVFLYRNYHLAFIVHTSVVPIGMMKPMRLSRLLTNGYLWLSGFFVGTSLSLALF